MPTIKIPWRSIRNYRLKNVPPLRPPLPQLSSTIDPIVRKFNDDMNKIGFITFGEWILQGHFHKNNINIEVMRMIDDNTYKAVSDTLVTCRVLFIQQSALKQLGPKYSSININVDKVRSGLCACINWIIGNKNFNMKWGNNNNILSYIGNAVVEYGRN